MLDDDGIQDLRRGAIRLSDQHLDEQIAVAAARRDVAAAHGSEATAATWAEVCATFAQIRDERSVLAAEMSDAISAVPVEPPC